MSKADRVSPLRAVNLNLIPVLRALLHEANVTRAGKAVGLSPSATSCALANLRRTLDDPLLVSTGRGMRLTPRAERMMQDVDRACVALEELLVKEQFHPFDCHRTFVVSALDYISMLVGKRILERMRTVAPQARVKFVDPSGDLEKDIEGGSVDLGIVALNILQWRGLSSKTRWKEHVVGIVDKDHPLARKAVIKQSDLDRFSKLDWNPSVSLSERFTGPIIDPGSQYRLNAVMLTPSYMVLPFLVLGTDLMAAVPVALAEYVSKVVPIKVIELPQRKEALEYGTLWSRLQDTDPAHVWFRQIVEEAMTAAYEGTA